MLNHNFERRLHGPLCHFAVRKGLLNIPIVSDACAESSNFNVSSRALAAVSADVRYVESSNF